MSGRRGFVVAALVAVLAGCGVPTGGPVETIPESDVPRGLASPSATAPAPAEPEPMAEPSRVYLVARDDSLVPRPREVTGPEMRDRLDALLRTLAAGPTADERELQLSTALPPDVELAVTDVAAGTVTIDLSGPAEAPTGLDSRRAVGQVVLSATSVPGVDEVVLTVDGERVEAPLPSGELSPDPLSAEDYAALLPAPPTPVPAPPS
ncbi:GerMN domain-containing protein [Geodermatophilus sp. SYSU D00697]